MDHEKDDDDKESLSGFLHPEDSYEDEDDY